MFVKADRPVSLLEDVLALSGSNKMRPQNINWREAQTTRQKR